MNKNDMQRATPLDTWLKHLKFSLPTGKKEAVFHNVTMKAPRRTSARAILEAGAFAVHRDLKAQKG
jgi:hypothetical protein